MTRQFFTLFFISSLLNLLSAQDFDEKYLEDQFYAGIAYNFLLDKPEGVIQQNLSYNLQLGFIRDIPINKRRNFGLGLGLGYATNSYYTNVIANELGGAISYNLPSIDFNRSKLETHGLEFPLEIRWRTSNPVDYKFWRIYAGIKAEYLFSRRSRLVTDQGNTAFANANIEQWQYGLMLNFGYNTWNLHLYWALSELLDENAFLNQQSLDIRPIRIGVIFYIL